MEDNLRMGSNNKKSGAKKKKSSGKSSKSRPSSQPEMEETAPPPVESSLSSKKRKAVEKQIPLEQKSTAGKTTSSIDQAKGKKSMSESLKAPTSREAWERQLRPRKLPKTFQDVRIGEADASRVIGRRLRVFWPLDNKWYTGLIKAFDAKKKRHHVVYDDGDEEWLELKKERVKILVASGEIFGDKSKVKEDECEGGINAPKLKEVSSSSSGDGKKSGAKRKRQSVVDIGKKNGGRGKEGQVKEEKQESAQEEEEEETRDGETVEGNAAVNKAMDSEQVGSVDAHSERNEALQNKEDVIENKDSHENENEVEGKNSKKVKSSRRTAPRTKRGASARRTQVKPITEHDDIEDVKVEEGSKAAENANLEDIIVPEVESILNDDDDDDEKKQQKAKESEKKADSSVTETDTVGDMDGKGSMKDVTKLDESATVAEQLEEQQQDDGAKQGNEDDPIRRTADQSSEKHLDVTGGDEKATEKQADVKDADQLNKKHNKKQRGKVKPREPVKK